MSERAPISLRFVGAGVIAVLLPFLAMCNRNMIKCNGFIQPDANKPVEAGKTITLTVDIDDHADALMTLKWRAEMGVITAPSERAKSVIYKAPDVAGEDTITVKVSNNRKVVDEKSMKLTICRPQTVGLNTQQFYRTNDDAQFHLVYKPVAGLRQENGVDLSDYDLQFTFLGGDGKNVQLYLRNETWTNIYSSVRPIKSNQPIRFNPGSDKCEVRQFEDFRHIYSIGAHVYGGMEDVKIVSATLVNRKGGCPEKNAEKSTE